MFPTMLISERYYSYFLNESFVTCSFCLMLGNFVRVGGFLSTFSIFYTRKNRITAGHSCPLQCCMYCFSTTYKCHRRSCIPDLSFVCFQVLFIHSSLLATVWLMQLLAIVSARLSFAKYVWNIAIRWLFAVHCLLRRLNIWCIIRKITPTIRILISYSGFLE